MKKTLAAFFLALLPALLSAQDQQFTFALPELEGRISLGVYDSGGKLVRVLFVAAGERNFKVGLNGLIATWNGRDEAGNNLPAGKYQVRGCVVGYDVKAEGEAYHFNDWIGGDDSPEISGLDAVVPGESGALIIHGFKPARESGAATDAMLLRYEEPAGLQLVAELPQKAKFLAGDATHVVIDDRPGGKLTLYALENPRNPVTAGTNGVNYSDAAFWKDQLVLGGESSGGTQLDAFDLSALKLRGNLSAPVAFRGLDANRSALLGWDATQVWLSRNGKFEAAPLKELPDDFSVSAGPDETFWIAGQSGAEIVVRQHAFDGELLREMKIPRDFAETVRIFASKTSLSFYLLLQSHNWSRQTLRGYRPLNAPPAGAKEEVGQVDWEIFLDKTIENSRRFGFVDGRLVPNAGDAPQKNERKLTLPPNTLEAKASPLAVKATCDYAGIWLRTGDGLPLLFLASRRFAERLVLSPGDTPHSLRVFAGDNVVVAEYVITGLENIAPIDAGKIEIP